MSKKWRRRVKPTFGSPLGFAGILWDPTGSANESSANTLPTAARPNQSQSIPINPSKSQQNPEAISWNQTRIPWDPVGPQSLSRDKLDASSQVIPGRPGSSQLIPAHPSSSQRIGADPDFAGFVMLVICYLEHPLPLYMYYNRQHPTIQS